MEKNTNSTSNQTKYSHNVVGHILITLFVQYLSIYIAPKMGSVQKPLSTPQVGKDMTGHVCCDR